MIHHFFSVFSLQLTVGSRFYTGRPDERLRCSNLTITTPPARLQCAFYLMIGQNGYRPIWTVVLVRCSLFLSVLSVAGSCTELYGVVRSCTELYGVVRSCTELYGVVRSCTELYGVVRSFTDLYGVVRGSDNKICSLFLRTHPYPSVLIRTHPYLKR